MSESKSPLPSTDWKENIAADEAKRFERYADILHTLQRKRSQSEGPLRALHAKGQLGVEASFSVLPDLAEHLRVGVFAEPAIYPAYVRFSNGAGQRQSDRKPDVRGIAIKVVGAGGTKIIPGMENAMTQDFLMIKTASTPFRNADEFIAFVEASVSPIVGLPRFAARFGVGRTTQIARRIFHDLSHPQASLAATHYYSAVPIQFGKYAIHYSLAPHTKAEPLSKSSDEYLSDDLAGRLRNGPVTYDFRVQFFVDEKRTPIEDASVEWQEKDAPFVTLARLTLRQQDVSSPRGEKVAAFVEGLSFDPWHASVDLRPLGDINRARNVAYRVSTQERQAAAEPTAVQAFD